MTVLMVGDGFFLEINKFITFSFLLKVANFDFLRYFTIVIDDDEEEITKDSFCLVLVTQLSIFYLSDSYVRIN